MGEQRAGREPGDEEGIHVQEAAACKGEEDQGGCRKVVYKGVVEDARKDLLNDSVPAVTPKLILKKRVS